MKMVLNFSTGMGPTALPLTSLGGQAERALGRMGARSAIIPGDLEQGTFRQLVFERP